MKTNFLLATTAVIGIVFGGTAALLLSHSASAQQTSAVRRPVAQTRSGTDAILPMTLRARIALPGVYGRMDHYGFDSKRGNIIVSAVGNDTVEIINSWKRVHTITGFDHPQGSLYVPDVDRIVVTDQW